MIDNNMIEIIKSRLVETYKPRAIYLFGSYAWGVPNEDSDLDLLIVVDKLTNTHHRMLVEGHLALARLDVAKDLLLYSKEQFDALSKDKLTLCYKIKHKGVKIYAKA